MKRREFLLTAGAAAAAPMAPMKLLAGGVPAPDLYAKAVQWAGVCEYSSAHSLKYRFGLDDDIAQGLFDRLVSNQVVGAPDTKGLARIAFPTFKNHVAAHQAKQVLQQKPSMKIDLKAHVLDEEVEVDDLDKIDTFKVEEV